MGQRVNVGDIVRHRESGRTGVVEDVTQLMSDDDRTPHALAVRFQDSDDGTMVRCLADEIEVIEKG